MENMASKQTTKIQAQIDAEKLCKHTLRITANANNFPKKYRFTLVDRVVRLSMEIHDHICDANNSYDMSERIKHLERGISSCRKMKFYTRLCQEVLKVKCSVPYWDSLITMKRK